MKIISIVNTEYKEKDCIVTAISDNETITFLAKSVYDSKCKNSVLSNPLIIADIELIEGNYKYPILKNCSIDFNPRTVDDDFEYLSSLMFIQEVTSKMLADDEKWRIFYWLNDGLREIKKNPTLKNYILLVYFANVMKIAGYEYEVNQCVFCGNKSQIVAFDFINGGFVCKDCITDGIEQNLTPYQMKLIRQIFKTKNYEFKEENLNSNEVKDLLNKLVSYIDNENGFNFTTLKLLDL